MSKIYPIAVPKWGIEMVEGTINTWNKAEGDAIAKGDEVFEMESDKIVNVWDSPVDGILRKVIAEEGDAHPVGAPLGVIAPADVSDADIDTFIANYSGEEAAEEAAPAPAPAPKSGGNDAYTRSSPSVRKLADELGVDLNTVEGTGRRGRITEDDVRAAAGGGAAGGDEDVEVIPLSATRKTIAKRLTEAKQTIPHFYLTVDYDIDGLLSHRASLNDSGSTKVSVNDLVVWCVGQALMKEPRVNVNLVGDDIHQFKRANVSVAIATDEGLYPATVRGVDTMSPADIATATAELAEKAKAGKLEKADITGGSFTVSNLGMFGVNNFTAIVNPPMGAILALGKGEQKMVVRDGEPTVATLISATLSCDHRVIDGAVGAKFLQVLGEEIAALS
ncbi:MAG: dihydrolipoamide acetyltransferase family protein [Halieaceae bacterium]|jgi:pyruvate dehydrogenase E2 component (dihydrolipoamide acetyltransferase)|nr:dihydrolipoamide acetyltransferase family protein [Halieaceae bacterium]